MSFADITERKTSIYSIITQHFARKVNTPLKSETAGDEFDAKVEKIYENLKNSKIEKEEDIPYDSNGQLTRIDIWGSQRAEKVFIMIHGGYWLFGNRKKCLAVVEVAQKLGYTVVSVGYDYASKNHLLSKTIEETMNGVKFALSKLENAKKVVLGGHSVGAHLAFQAVTRIKDPRISGLYLSAGIYKLKELVFTTYGQDLGLTEEEADYCSCDYTLLKHAEFPILIANCKFESPKLYKQNVELSKFVQNANYKEYADADHFTILTELANDESAVYADFFNFLHSI